MAGNRSGGLQAWGITFLRVVVGLVFVMHGGQKLFISGFPNVAGMMRQLGVPLPMGFAVVVTFVEFFGGIALVLGIFVRSAAFLIAFDMLVAVLLVHLHAGFFLPRGFEYALTLLAASVMLALTGPGAAALSVRRVKH
jgi:putative oxidoreductase